MPSDVAETLAREVLLAPAAMASYRSRIRACPDVVAAIKRRADAALGADAPEALRIARLARAAGRLSGSALARAIGVHAEAKACHAPPAVPEIAEFSTAEGGHSVGEIYAEYPELADKPVKIRGQVVKFSPEILSTNWLHIQDGTGSVAGATYDLAIRQVQQQSIREAPGPSHPVGW